MEGLVNTFIKIFAGLETLKYGKEIVVFIISLMPILELRGGLLAASLMGVKPVPAYIVSIIGNIIPVPFILLFLNVILEWMKKCKVKWMNKLAKWLEKKADKNKSQIEKYGYWGLLLFVGIPLPGTGAWTGCLVASVLHLDRKKAFIAAMGGILLASVIMMIISYGLLGALID
ncbi:MAG: small multi-drug export protein [Clostridia bacterium]|nr:small multi-drug export protein [Clostridia bacterium]